MSLQIDLGPGAQKSWLDYAVAIGSVVGVIASAATALGSLLVARATSRYASAAQSAAEATRDSVAGQAEASAAQLKASNETAAATLRKQTELTGEQIAASFRTAALQSRASVVSASRQRWIDALRDDMADLLAANDAYRSLEHQGSMTAEGQDALHRYEEDLMVRRILLRNRIDLRLNPEKANHQALIHAIDLWLAANTSISQIERLAVVKDDLKALLRTEWLRVKREAAGEDTGEPP